MHKNIGLFFGSFNPIHVGHLMIASYIHQSVGFDETWFVISPHNPLKDSNSLASEKDRLRMVQIAIGQCSFFKACDTEFYLPKPSYTIKTLEALREEYPDYHFNIIVGSDNIDVFDQWKDYQKILDNYQLIVYPRMPFKASSCIYQLPTVKLVEAPYLDISSTFIRRSIAKAWDMRFFLPEGVAEYIRDEKLYVL